jgi:hypothetical protein
MAAKAFTGGDKLLKRLAELSTKVSKKSTFNVGFLQNATYPDGTLVALVAAINEFGAPSRNQPPRPFFRSMITAKSPEWGDQLGKVLKSTDYNTDTSMGLMGESIKGELQVSIIEFSGAPLAPATIAAKGFDKQLIDTGHMKDSVDYEIKDKA